MRDPEKISMKPVKPAGQITHFIPLHIPEAVKLYSAQCSQKKKINSTFCTDTVMVHTYVPTPYKSHN